MKKITKKNQNETEFEIINRKLEEIKSRDSTIREAFKIYCAQLTQHNKDGICELIGQRCGLSRSKIWEIVNNKENGDDKIRVITI